MRPIWRFLPANIGMLPDLSRPHKGRIAPAQWVSGFERGGPAFLVGLEGTHYSPIFHVVCIYLHIISH